MTPEKINLIQQSFELIRARADETAAVFYRRLFAANPSLEPLFPRDMTEQKKKLMMTLDLAVKSLAKSGTLLPVLENLGRKHRFYGVREEHYAAVGKALLVTLRDALGQNFTIDVKAAWAEMYDFVAAAMKRAAAGAHRPDECPTAKLVRLDGEREKSMGRARPAF
jgi:hemoglobin-like flavoprotein